MRFYQRQSKAVLLREQLDAELALLAFGQRLAPIRSLLVKYHIGREVLNRVLDDMEQEGLIRRVPQVGTFCCRRDPERKKLVTLAVPDFAQDGINPNHVALRQAFEADGRFLFQRVALREPYYQNLRTTGGDVLLLGMPTYELKPEHFRLISELSVPAVFLGRSFYDFGLHFTDTKPGFGGVLAAQCLLDKGHRRLAVLVAEPFVAEIKARVSEFICFAQAHQATVKLINAHTKPYESCISHAYDAISEYLSCRACDFTGIFVASDTSALGALRAFYDFGLRVPDDVSMVGYDGLPQAEYYIPPLTTVSENFPLHAQLLVEAIGEYFDGKRTLIRIEAPPFLEERQSLSAVTEPVGIRNSGCPLR